MMFRRVSRWLVVVFSPLYGQIHVNDTVFAKIMREYYPKCISQSGILDTTCAKNSKNTFVYIGGKDVKDISEIVWFRNLDTLEIDSCNIKILPKLPEKLQRFCCSTHGILDSIVLPMPFELRSMIIGPNRIRRLMFGGLLNLEFLMVSEFSLELVELPENLKELHMNRIPQNLNLRFPQGLETLSICASDLRNKKLNFPKRLKSLTLSNCNLTYLPELPDLLLGLSVGNNKIKIIDNLPPNLKWFAAEYNSIERLPPILPKNLETLTIFGNRIKKMPIFNSKKLKHIDMSGNCLGGDYKERHDNGYNWSFGVQSYDCK